MKTKELLAVAGLGLSVCGLMYFAGYVDGTTDSMENQTCVIPGSKQFLSSLAEKKCKNGKCESVSTLHWITCGPGSIK